MLTLVKQSASCLQNGSSYKAISWCTGDEKSHTRLYLYIPHRAAMTLGARNWELYSCCPVWNRRKDSVSGQETGEQFCTPCQVARPWLPVQSAETKVILVPQSGMKRSQSCLLDATSGPCSLEVRITLCLLTLDATVVGLTTVSPTTDSYTEQPECGGSESDGLWRPFCCFKVLGGVCHIPLATGEAWSFSSQCYCKYLTSPVAERIQMINCLGSFMLLGTSGYPSPWTLCLENYCRIGA